MGDLAYAMGGLPGGGGGAAGGLGALIPLVLMFAVFYFILIRPQQKKQREHRQMLDALKTGDVVLTQGGLYGKIVGINERVVKLKVAENVTVDVARSSIADKMEKVPAGKEKEKDK